LHLKNASIVAGFHENGMQPIDGLWFRA